MAYVELEDVLAYLGVSGAGDDALLASFIPAAKTQLDKKCRRTFEAPEDTTRYYRIESIDNPQLWRSGLRSNWPAWDEVDQTRRTGFLDLDCDVVSITTLTNGDGTIITPDKYWLTPLNETPKSTIELKSSAIWNMGSDDLITVTGRFAYAITAPEDIQTAAKMLIAYWYRNKDNQGFDVVTIPGGSGLQIPSGWPTNVEMILREGNYIRPLGVV